MSLNKLLSQWIAQSLDLSEKDLEAWLETPKDSQFGDVAFPCFHLARKRKKAPHLIAKDYEAEFSKLIKDSSMVESVKATGPYLNFRYKTHFLAQKITESLKESLEERPSTGKKVLIEYSQPNTHKAFHVGHMRNVALGDSLCRLMKWSGHKVLAANYIGDEGTHIAKFLWYYLNHFKGTVPEKNKGEFLGRLYTKATHLLDLLHYTKFPIQHVLSAKVVDKKPYEKWHIVNLDVGKLGLKTVLCGGVGYSAGDVIAYATTKAQIKGRRVGVISKGSVQSEGMILSEKEAEMGGSEEKIWTLPSQTPLGQPLCQIFCHKSYQDQDVLKLYEKNQKEVSEILRKLENQDQKLLSIWQETKAWSMEEFKGIYDWLDVHFDHYFYESELGEKGKQIVLDGLKKDFLTKNENAIGAELDNLPFFLLLKSDGNTLYSTKDLALADLKFTQYTSDQYIYVVDIGQSLHFKQVFQTLSKLGYKEASDCYHLAYGKVETVEGKMSSRKGNVIYFSQLKKDLMETITKDHLKKYEDQWTKSQIKEAAHKIALATIKYGMLNQDQQNTIVFDKKKWVSLNGNTGPYLLYTYARIQSILRKFVASEHSPMNRKALHHSKEHALLQKLMLFDNTMKKAVKKREPQILCIYLFELSQDFNQFYASCPILKPSESSSARKEIAENTSLVLKKGLSLLGVPVISQM